MVTDEKLTMSVRDAAKAIGVSHTSLFNSIKRGEFWPVIRIGHRILVSRAGLERYLAGNPNAGSAAR